MIPVITQVMCAIAAVVLFWLFVDSIAGMYKEQRACRKVLDEQPTELLGRLSELEKKKREIEGYIHETEMLRLDKDIAEVRKEQLVVFQSIARAKYDQVVIELEDVKAQVDVVRFEEIIED